MQDEKLPVLEKPEREPREGKDEDETRDEVFRYASGQEIKRKKRDSSSSRSQGKTTSQLTLKRKKTNRKTSSLHIFIHQGHVRRDEPANRVVPKTRRKLEKKKISIRRTRKSRRKKVANLPLQPHPHFPDASTLEEEVRNVFMSTGTHNLHIPPRRHSLRKRTLKRNQDAIFFPGTERMTITMESMKTLLGRKDIMESKEESIPSFQIVDRTCQSSPRQLPTVLQEDLHSKLGQVFQLNGN